MEYADEEGDKESRTLAREGCRRSICISLRLLADEVVPPSLIFRVEMDDSNCENFENGE